MAHTLIEQRLRARGMLLFPVAMRDDIPRRRDLEEEPDYRTHKHTLYGKQEGTCTGCKVWFPFRNMTVDHKVPVDKGGSDHKENLQLLCGACNSMKHTSTQAQLIAKLKKQGIRK